MKGRRQFNTNEIARIRVVLLERHRTKHTRDQLRNIGFYISDFGRRSPFTISHLDRLIATGQIIVGGRVNAPVTESASQPKPRFSAAIANSNAEVARKRYRPVIVRHLMVGESAPIGGKFFYHANSILFRHTCRAFRDVFGNICGEGESFLRFFRDQGFYLDDLCAVPVNGMDDAERFQERANGIRPLAKRIEIAKPQSVIVVMKAIVPEVSTACDIACVPSNLIALPFPLYPRDQQRFVEGLADFLGRSAILDGTGTTEDLR